MFFVCYSLFQFELALYLYFWSDERQILRYKNLWNWINYFWPGSVGLTISYITAFSGCIHFVTVVFIMVQSWESLRRCQRTSERALWMATRNAPWEWPGFACLPGLQETRHICEIRLSSPVCYGWIQIWTLQQSWGVSAFRLLSPRKRQFKYDSVLCSSRPSWGCI